MQGFGGRMENVLEQSHDERYEWFGFLIAGERNMGW
jgi:hypothetical protein